MTVTIQAIYCRKKTVSRSLDFFQIFIAWLVQLTSSGLRYEDKIIIYIKASKNYVKCFKLIGSGTELKKSNNYTVILHQLLLRTSKKDSVLDNIQLFLFFIDLQESINT